VSRRIESVDWYLLQIQQLWPDFKDDGLSGGFPDWLYSRHDLHLAGRVHDWHYCTRCHRAGSMTWRAKGFADRALRKHARELLPWYLQIAPIVLHLGVRLGGNSSWDSCGPDVGERCRHNIKMPVWMVRPEGV
jgi:hypothetical protein